MTTSEESISEARRRSDGERTHAAILDAATQLASIEGVHGLTIGRLAEALGVSKSGLYAHFGSKEQLQLETIEAAKAIFEEEVMRPALEAPPGLPQLEAILDGFFTYVERGVFPGGCFFAGLLAEVDARSGPIHDVAAAWELESLEGLAAPVMEAQRNGRVAPDVDAQQVAFELYACLAARAALLLVAFRHAHHLLQAPAEDTWVRIASHYICATVPALAGRRCEGSRADRRTRLG